MNSRCTTTLRLRRKQRRLLSGIALTIMPLAAFCASWQAEARPPQVASAPSDIQAAKLLQYQGASSCAAAACHNAGHPHGLSGSEHRIWFSHDQHARAYAVLTTQRSQIIERNYRGSVAGNTPKAEADTTCLKCHALAPELAGTAQAHLNLDGVSCERCHGRAEKWLAIHYLSGWRDKTGYEKRQYGMTLTADLAARAKLCAECHIGTPDNDLNHDLYAAGHPPLYYEYSAFLGSMPKHWNEREEKRQYPDFEARVWALGQIVSAQAALTLLAHRAHDTERPWPEFAEYNCYACHHNLRVGEPTPAHPARGTPGRLPWNSWFTPLLPSVLDLPNQRPEMGTWRHDLATLREEMEKPLPRRALVYEQANRITSQLAQALHGLDGAKLDVASLEALDRTLQSQSSVFPPTDWEGLTQVYLARAALYRARKDLEGGYTGTALRRQLEDLRRRLELPFGFRSRADGTGR
ncbi:MAG TPA: multiheme c-type cytochrome [Gemmataceae bacterium]|nr:multiheme c-type cytochrome [Gemmataceae bacterium]